MAKSAKDKTVSSVEVVIDGKVEMINPNKKTKLSRREKTGYFFVLPYVIVFCIFSIYPVCRTFYLSFFQIKQNVHGDVMNFVGFDKYTFVLKDQIFWESLRNTVFIWGINIVLQLGLAFLLTIIFSDIKYKIKGIGIYRAIYYLPNIIAATSIAFLFTTLLNPKHGSVNHILSQLFGKTVEIDWIGDPNIAFATIGVIQAWMWFGNSFIMLMAGVMGISRDLYEAAAIDGAGRWNMFTKLTLPLLKPIMLYVFVTSLIGGLQMFDLPFIMVGSTSNAYPRVRTAIMYLYQYGMKEGNQKDLGRAAATAYILFFIILVFSVLQFIMMRDKEED